MRTMGRPRSAAPTINSSWTMYLCGSGFVEMFAVEETCQIPDCELVGKRLRCGRTTQRRHGPTHEPAACRSEKISRDATKIRNVLRLSSIQHTARNATPERPAPVILFGKTRSWYQMINLQLRQV